MTAEELALLGYQPGQTASPDLNAAQSSVTPQDLQQFYAMASNPNAGAPDPSQINSQPTFIDPAILDVISPMPASDPNGFTSNQPNVVTAADGSPMVLPPNSGAANTYGGQPAPAQPVQQAPSPAQPDQSQAPKLTPWQQYLSERGIGPNSVVDMASHRELLKGFNALQLKQLEMQDPEKQLKVQQLQHSVANQGIDDQLKQAQAAESQSKVIAGELAKGKALQDASNQVAALETQRDNLQAIADHPELKYVVGAARFLPAVSPGQRDLKARLAQVSGQNLISGINMIKDEASTPGSSLGFRITQQEAQAVKDAVNRLQTYQEPETFKNSVNEYVGILNKAIDAKKAQIDQMPSVNRELLKQFSYSPASAATSASSTPSGSAAKGAPQLRTVGGKTYQLNPATGGWRPIN